MRKIILAAALGLSSAVPARADVLWLLVTWNAVATHGDKSDGFAVEHDAVVSSYRSEADCLAALA
jgi:hypothetical protein